MKLITVDQIQGSLLRKAFDDRQIFTLTGAGVSAQFVADKLDFEPSYDDCDISRMTLGLEQVSEITVVKPWDGEGLPPAGTVCEWEDGAGLWHEAEVRYVSEWTIVLKFVINPYGDDIDDLESALFPRDVRLRPLRTPEQIAAEERIEAIAAMMKIVVYAQPEDMARLYAAGYRKRVAP